MFTWAAAYTLIKYWGPVLAVGTFVVKTFLAIRKSYQEAKASISVWADAMLNNHIHTIEVGVTDLNKKMEDQTKEIVSELRQTRTELIAVVTATK